MAKIWPQMKKIFVQLAIYNPQNPTFEKAAWPGPSLLHSYIKLHNLYSQFMTKKDQFFSNFRRNL